MRTCPDLLYKCHVNDCLDVVVQVLNGQDEAINNQLNTINNSGNYLNSTISFKMERIQKDMLGSLLFLERQRYKVQGSKQLVIAAG